MVNDKQTVKNNDVGYSSLILTHKGAQEVASLEIKELIGQNSNFLNNGLLSFEAKFNDLIKLCYMSQSVSYVGILLSKQKFSSSKFDVTSINVDYLKTLFNSSMSFSLRIRNLSNASVDVTSIEKDVGGMIKDFLEKEFLVEFPVSLNSPQLQFVLIVNDGFAYLTIDFSGIDLSKRSYKINNTGSSLKGTVAYTALRLAGYNGGSKILLDPMCGTGIIPIEASLFSNSISPHKFGGDFAFKNFMAFDDSIFKKLDSLSKSNTTEIYGFDHTLKQLKSSRKHAKLAGVDKAIDFSKVSLDWLDTKFSDATVDFIITDPPKEKSEIDKKLESAYDELCYQSKLILKKGGVLAVLLYKTDLFIEVAKRHSFEIFKTCSFSSGKLDVTLLIFKKK